MHSHFSDRTRNSLAKILHARNSDVGLAVWEDAVKLAALLEFARFTTAANIDGVDWRGVSILTGVDQDSITHDQKLRTWKALGILEAVAPRFIGVMADS